jgi:hypothetical protein
MSHDSWTMLITSIRICTNYDNENSTCVFSKNVKCTQFYVSNLSLWNILHTNSTLKKAVSELLIQNLMKIRDKWSLLGFRSQVTSYRCITFAVHKNLNQEKSCLANLKQFTFLLFLTLWQIDFVNFPL